MLQIYILFCLYVLETKTAEDRVIFSSKTPYKLVENLNTTIVKPDPSCTPIHINMVFRHGHRYPSDGNIEDITNMGNKINKGKFIANFNITLPWINPFAGTKALEKTLTTIGEKELYGIGSRIRQRFPELFTKTYTPINYKFTSSNKLRTIHSANSFAAAILDNTGSLGPRKLQPIAIDVRRKDPYDQLLRFYDACPKYQTEIKDDPEAIKELKKFEGGKELEDLYNRLMERIGIPESERLTIHDLNAMYEMCAYEIGMFNGSLEGGICSLFNATKDIPLLEYAADLEDFYTANIGHEISYKISCPLVTDIVDELKKVSQNKSTYSGVFRAGHSTTILMTMALLGANIEPSPPLKADNYNTKRNRIFKTSKLTPFAANIYFVLYQCSNEKQIQMYINERLTKIPCCQSPIECKFDDFLKCYERIVQECDFQKMCDSPTSTTTHKTPSSSSMRILGQEPIYNIFLMSILFMIF